MMEDIGFALQIEDNEETTGFYLYADPEGDPVLKITLTR